MPLVPLDLFYGACVANGLQLGVSPHYLAALALVRSGVNDPATLNDDPDGEKFGPYRITRDDWDQRRTANDVGPSSVDIDDIGLEADDLPKWTENIAFAALTAFRARTAFHEKSDREPSALELYALQWPGAEAAPESVWQTALDATANGILAALTAEFGSAPGAEDGGKIAKSTDPVVPPKPPASAPAPAPASATNVNVTSREQLFFDKAAGLVTKLMAAFPLKDFQAAAILGNLGEESGGFHALHEKLAGGVDGPGLGWAQWSFDRRKAFEAYCLDHGVSTSSDAGNLGYLTQELKTTEKAAIAELTPTTTLTEAVKAFEQSFERALAGRERFDMRNRYASLALAAFSQSKRLPASVSALIDPDLDFAVVDKAQAGADVYWLIAQSAERAGQLIVKQTDQTAVVVLRAVSVFPLPEGLLPAAVAAQFSRKVSQPAPVPQGPAGGDTDQQIAAKIFAQARAAVNTLITRDVQGTHNGRLACAWAVNHIAQLATGSPIGGGLSSDLMCGVLQKNHIRIESDGDVTPGCIVISPTHGATTGHVGIVGTLGPGFGATLIYSNSSSHAKFMQNFTVSSWRNHYGSRGLDVRFYRLKGAGAATDQAGGNVHVISFAFGDSLAVGQNATLTRSGLAISPDGKLATLNGRLIGETGAPPRKVLRNLADCLNADANVFKGKAISLSSGVTNDPDEIDVVAQQLETLKTAGAKVVLDGVANNAFLQGQLGTAVNALLKQAAAAGGVPFLGGYVAEAADSIHRTPGGYRSMVTLAGAALS